MSRENALADKALLPTGLYDVLPPDAAFEAEVVERLMACFARHGYERVKPPLLEFEDTLLAGSGAALAGETFRLMDPVSQRMMGVRPDMTMQVARIAATRLRHWPRPLRLGYAGQVLRVKGSQLRRERQFGQVGAELIGAPEPAADAEVILMAVEALDAVGVGGLSVDLGLPTLVPALLSDGELDGAARRRLLAALDRKDAGAVADLGLPAGVAKVLAALARATGPAERVLGTLDRLQLPEKAARERAALAAVVERLRAGAPELALTVDAVENRGLQYHTGVAFTFFAKGVRGELGSGGRYLAGDRAGDAAAESAGEPATGLTLFTDTLLRAARRSPPAPRVFVPAGAASSEGRRLRAEGWTTVGDPAAAADEVAEAGRLRCTHVLSGGRPVELGKQRSG
jgi:ATP phosphoribosyltransferase regulatory subunit